jgi:hypothetical protein
MKILVRLLIAALVASVVPGPVILIGMGLIPDPSRLLGTVLVAVLALPLAMYFGATISFIPAAALGTSLYLMSRALVPTRRRVWWFAAGFMCGFCLVRYLGPVANPFADLRTAVLCGIAGATSMLAFHVVMQPRQGPVAPSKTTRRVALGGLAVAISACGSLLALWFADRQSFAPPDHARLFYAVPHTPRTVTLFSYATPQPSLGGATWRTDGHSITLIARTQGYRSENSIVDFAQIALSPSDIIRSGGRPADFTTTRPDPNNGTADVIPVMLSIDRELAKIENPAQFISRPPLPGERRKIDAACAIGWRWRENPLPQFSESPAPILEGMLLTTRDPVALRCTGATCAMTFGYRGTVARVSMQRSAICSAANLRAIVIRALDERLIRETPKAR